MHMSEGKDFHIEPPRHGRILIRSRKLERGAK
jgi:hypothetical protein